MFLREVKRENRNGTQVSYLQLVHNDWDPAARPSRTKILYSFGRTDQVDTAAIERLIVSLSRLLDPAAALRATAGSDLSFICSRPLGGTDVLDGLWRRLGIDTAMSRLLATRGAAPRSSGCCSGWSPTGHWPRPRSWPPQTGSPTTCTSTGFPRHPTMSATGRWT